MKEDPVIQAVRDARHEISEFVGHDPRKLLEYYRERQERLGDQLVRRHPDGLTIRDEDAGQPGSGRGERT